jgi:hypothetical protein
MEVKVYFRSLFGKLMNFAVKDVQNTPESVNVAAMVVTDHAKNQNIELTNPVLVLIQGAKA